MISICGQFIVVVDILFLEVVIMTGFKYAVILAIIFNYWILTGIIRRTGVTDHNTCRNAEEIGLDPVFSFCNSDTILVAGKDVYVIIPVEVKNYFTFYFFTL